MAPPNRKGGGGLSLRTLVIASLASATAAMVTSRLFPPGAIFTAALTPVIVAAISEAAHRPVNRVAALREQRWSMVLEAREARVAEALGEEPSPLRGAPGLAQGAAAEEEGFSTTNGGGAGHYGADPFGPRERPRRRRIHPKLAIATGLAAFAIAAAALTLPELIFGAVASNHQTTFFGGGGTHHAKTQDKAQQQDASKTGAGTTDTTASQTTPAQATPTTTTDSGTQTTGTTTTTNTGTTTTTDTGTQTSPVPGAPPAP